MTRQKDSKKDRRKYVDRVVAGNDVSPFISGVTENSSSTRLQPLKTGGKGNRLPPLNSRRLPELKHVPSDNRPHGGPVPPVPPAPLLPLARSDISTPGKTDLDSATPKNIPKGAEECNKAKAPHVAVRAESDVALKQESHSVLQNICVPKKMNTEAKPVPPSTQRAEKEDKTPEKNPEKIPHRGKPMPKLLPEPSIVRSHSKLAKLMKQDSVTDCRKEKDLLRQHRKQQAERMKAVRQPLKATQAYDTLGKEVKRKTTDIETSQKSSSREVRKVDLSVRRKCNDEDDWDWDKDIEEYMALDEKDKIERPSTSGQHPVQNGGHRLSPVPPPLSSSCSKRGVGFKSKKKIEEERLQQLARQEEKRQKEEKEKERIEMMLPQKVKKSLTKYGFR